VYRWRRRAPDFLSHSSRPRRSPQRTSDALEATVLGLRLELRWGPDLLGPYVGLPVSTTHRILRRHGAHRLRELFPRPRPTTTRFVVATPGYIAVDIKSLGRLDRGGGREWRRRGRAGDWAVIGWNYLHVAIDLASRLVYAELRRGQVNADTVEFLEHAVAFFDAKGIRAQRVLTDNGTSYKRTFDEACRALGLRHTRTRPYHPWTNGRVEAAIGTISRECLYARHFTHEDERRLALALYLAYYNRERPHTSLGGIPPSTWLRRSGVTGVAGDFN
jgi:transposase InsO family protein